MQRRIVSAVIAVLLVAGVLLLRHHLAPEQVVERRFLGAVEAFEQEQLLSVMAVISRGYGDPWGLDYETLGAHLKQTMDTFDDLQVTLEPPDVEATPEGSVVVEAVFVVWGSYEGQRGYVVGTLTDPCRARMVWREEQRGWMLTTLEELVIPELEDELERRRATSSDRP